MRWSVWISLFGRKAEGPELAIGREVMFRRANFPEPGRIAGEGDEIRVPLHRLNSSGGIASRRLYWRNRSQLYVRARP